MPKLVILSVVTVALAFLAYSADPFIFRILMLFSAFWVCLPVSVGCLLALLIAGVARRSAEIPLSILKYLLAIILLSWVAGSLNSFIFNQAEAEAKAYPEKIVPLLEAYRRQQGRYPSSLDVLKDKPSVPRLLRKPDAYKSDGKTFLFSFPKPGGLMDFWHFESETRVWRFIS